MSESAEERDEQNREVIFRLVEDGDDLSKARDVEFSVTFPDAKAAEEFASKLRPEGYAVSLKRLDTEEGLLWDVTIVRHMLLICQTITEFELFLEATASPLGGRFDGWGCFAQKPSNQH